MNVIIRAIIQTVLVIKSYMKLTYLYMVTEFFLNNNCLFVTLDTDSGLQWEVDMGNAHKIFLGDTSSDPLERLKKSKNREHLHPALEQI